MLPLLEQEAVISIHALHEESDMLSRPMMRILPISIHALHEESDALVIIFSNNAQRFQSTLSMRRATFVAHFR